MSAIELRQVEVTYGRRRALLPFTETVDSGGWLGVIGPNGAGKSSLLRAIAGLVHAGGSVAVDGQPLDELAVRDRAGMVAYVPQSPLIPDDMSVFDYVLLGRTPYVPYFGTPGAADREIAVGVLDRLDLADFATRRLGELSGGERQRVVLARALAQQAPVLLLDEPTAALDIGHQQQALELVSELRIADGLTVISALHDLTLAGTYADRLSMLHDGAVVASGPATEVLTAERLGEVYQVRVSVEIDEDGTVVVIPRRGSPAA